MLPLRLRLAITLALVDASVAAKWFFAESGDQWARELAEGEDVLIAPDLIVTEVCNTAWKKVSRAEASADQATGDTTRARKLLRTGFPRSRLRLMGEPPASEALLLLKRNAGADSPAPVRGESAR